MPVTIDTILGWLREQVEARNPVDAHTWVEAAQKLNMLIGDEHDKLFDLEQLVAVQRHALIEAGRTVAAAKVMIEASTDYKEMRRQKARIGRIEEMIRIAKIQARLKDSEYRMN